MVLFKIEQNQLDKDEVLKVCKHENILKGISRSPLSC